VRHIVLACSCPASLVVSAVKGVLVLATLVLGAARGLDMSLSSLRVLGEHGELADIAQPALFPRLGAVRLSWGLNMRSVFHWSVLGRTLVGVIVWLGRHTQSVVSWSSAVVR